MQWYIKLFVACIFNGALINGMQKPSEFMVYVGESVTEYATKLNEKYHIIGKNRVKTFLIGLMTVTTVPIIVSYILNHPINAAGAVLFMLMLETLNKNSSRCQVT